VIVDGKSGGTVSLFNVLTIYRLSSFPFLSSSPCYYSVLFIRHASKKISTRSKPLSSPPRLAEQTHRKGRRQKRRGPQHSMHVRKIEKGLRMHPLSWNIFGGHVQRGERAALVLLEHGARGRRESRCGKGFDSFAFSYLLI
jgi:hypothetical protein